MPARYLHILLANPRGFCAGVDRAIKMVERALEKWGAPVYVRHEIVHNRTVVDELCARGAVFVDDLAECPDDRPVVFSAHGVPAEVPAEACRRGMLGIDAICPLVSKVHAEARNLHRKGRHILLIGHAGHAEVLGTMGQIPEGAATLVQTADEVRSLTPPPGRPLAYLTQTTLSVDDTADIVAALRARFPDIEAPRSSDICYATTNRQNAVRTIAGRSDLVLVVGWPNSSNALRLVEVARQHGAASARLVGSAAAIDWDWFESVRTLGISAGASTPEGPVRDLVDACARRFRTTVEEIGDGEDRVVFRLPRLLERASA